MFKKIRKAMKLKKYNYAKSYHSTFDSLPKDVKKFIKDREIKNYKDLMYDVDIYCDIDIRNYWSKGDNKSPKPDKTPFTEEKKRLDKLSDEIMEEYNEAYKKLAK